MSQAPDATEFATLMRERLQKIKENPRQALFSDYQGTSEDGNVTAWVDMMGRLQRLRIAPDSYGPGREEFMSAAVLNACRAAQHAANHLDFNRAEFARELGDALNRKESAPQTSQGEQPKRERTSDDDFFDSNQSWMR